jgi:hypothetical protein
VVHPSSLTLSVAKLHHQYFLRIIQGRVPQIRRQKRSDVEDALVLEGTLWGEGEGRDVHRGDCRRSTQGGWRPIASSARRIQRRFFPNNGRDGPPPPLARSRHPWQRQVAPLVGCSKLSRVSSVSPLRFRLRSLAALPPVSRNPEGVWDREARLSGREPERGPNRGRVH